MKSRGDCIFCQIVSHLAPASVVFEDKYLLAFMDIQPVTRGHILLVPKAHLENIADLGLTNIAGKLFKASLGISEAVRKATRCEGINLFVADGEVAGQEIFHFHLHIIPRYVGDGFGIRHPPSYPSRPARRSLNNIARSIKQALVLG